MKNVILVHCFAQKFWLSLLLIFFSSFLGYSQCEDFSNFPNGEQEGKKTHVLYRDYIRSENFKAAFPLWQKLYKYAPAAHVYHFIDGISIYKHFIEKTEDETTITNYTQKIIDLYQQRIKCLSPKRKDEGKVRGMMVYDMYWLGYDDMKTYDEFKKVLEIQGSETPYHVLTAYADHSIRLFLEDKLEKMGASQIATYRKSQYIL